MNKLPIKLKNKLIELQKNAMEQNQLILDISDILEYYDLSTEIFTSNTNASIEEQTEALSYISCGEGYINDNLKEFEEIFLYHVNKSSQK